MTLCKPIYLTSMVLVSVQSPAFTFSPALIEGADTEIDLSILNSGGQLPGTYPVDIFINQTRVDYRSITFLSSMDNRGKKILLPRITRKTLAGYGIKMPSFGVSDIERETGYVDMSKIPGAEIDYHFNEQVLHLNIPQIYLKPTVDGIAPKTLWDNGIPAILMTYHAGTSQSVARGTSAKAFQYSWLQLSPGVNLGAWRLRNITNWQQSTGTPGHWQVINTYLERGIDDLKSRVTLGERYTPSEIFDSVPFRGVMLASDDRMVPSSQYLFAPVIRGVARTQARVEVRQNGFTVYNRVVSAGPFALTDLNPNGSGGDFQVTVWEADGVSQKFTVPFQTPAIALKEGYLRYSMMAGQYRSSDKRVINAPVIESTAMYGLQGGITVYGGVQAARYYQSSSFGSGVNMGDWGALSTDVTFSRGQRWDEAILHGQSWRLRYSKEIVTTRTSLSLVNFQFSQANYLTLNETLDSWRKERGDRRPFRRNKKKRRTGLSVNQGLGQWGYFNVGAYYETYWNSRLHDATLNAGYAVPVKGVTLSFNWATTQRAGYPRRSHLASLWLSVPLNKWTGSPSRASYRYTGASTGRSSHSLGLSGNAFEQRFHWDVNQRYSPGNSNSRHNGEVYLGWNGTYGQISGGYAYDRHYQQRMATIDGGLIGHRNGITLTQPLGDTNALIEARGASGVKILGYPGISTDYRGYTAQPYLSPYQNNLLSIDPASLPGDAEVEITDRNAVPTAGAVIAVKFKTHIGTKAIITLLLPDGRKMPFGTVVHVKSVPDAAGIVDNNGQVYLSGLTEKGQLIVHSRGLNYHCLYRLEIKSIASDISISTVQCAI